MIKLIRLRFLAMFVAPNAAFIGAAWFTPPAQLIGLFSAILLALSIGVCVAYHRPVRDILFGDEPLERSDWLALGIFLSWFGNLILRLHSIIWRALGRPDWLENNHAISYSLFMIACAAAFHLAAPGAIGLKRVPTERWVKIGVLSAFGVFAATLLGYALDWLGLIRPAG